MSDDADKPLRDYRETVFLPDTPFPMRAGLPQAVSNQLQRLSDLGILASRRDGNSIHYRLVDLCVRSLLDQGLCLVEEVSERSRGRGRACCG